MRTHNEFTAHPEILPDGSVAFESSDGKHWGMADLTGMQVTESITMPLPAGWSYDDVREFES